MSVSPNSINDSPKSEEPGATVEGLADLSQNLDEVLDLQLGIGALGGLRQSRACDAAERSVRRYDDRNHRLHESRMKHLGLEGEEKEPKADDMSQQVLIRSPVHNHYHQQPEAVRPVPASQLSSLSTLAKLAIAAALATGLGGGGFGLASYLADRNTTNITQGEGTGVGLVEPGPPRKSDE